MNMAENCEIRRYRRFKGWNYAKGASLFITIATAPRRMLFGRVVGGKVELSKFGSVVRGALEAMPRLNPGLLLFGFVIMPDHIHFNCAIVAGLAEPLKVLGRAIRRFKSILPRSPSWPGWLEWPNAVRPSDLAWQATLSAAIAMVAKLCLAKQPSGSRATTTICCSLAR